MRSYEHWSQRNVVCIKALSMTMVDLFENEKLRQNIRKEFDERKGDQVWKAMLPDGPPPVEESKKT